MKCIYHNDLDGKCSAAIIRSAYPEVGLIGIEHGDTFPWNKTREGEKVFMVDWSFTPFGPAMIYLSEKVDLVWIDHHRDALDDYIALASKNLIPPLPGNRGIDQAACELAWRYCFGAATMPRAVYMLGRQDVRDCAADSCSLPFQCGMQAEETSPNSLLWDDLLGLTPPTPFERAEDIVQRIVRNGETILAYQDQVNAQMAHTICFDTKMDGLSLLTANVPANHRFFESVWNPEKYDACCVFQREGTRWRVSLYTDRQDVDVGQIAKARGGGGHAGAAGFRCTELPFDQGRLAWAVEEAYNTGWKDGFSKK